MPRHIPVLIVIILLTVSIMIAVPEIGRAATAMATNKQLLLWTIVATILGMLVGFVRRN